ncbi:MAG TPA: methyltransferase domain-containing protein [Candidatus Binataceae bacterium]|nr:methyltransferase domain-containing protein [Candidatus Binataceae bacterium]
MRAFAAVPREHFLGPGPWKLLLPLRRRAVKRIRKRRSPRTFLDFYRTTPDSHPRHLYDDVLVGIVPERGLNNGQPSGLARWFEALELKRGDRLMHVGSGTGYYSAILAHVVGPKGRIIAVEIDADLAPRARANLAHLKNVEVAQADGTKYEPGEVDAIFVNAGANHPCPVWLDSLAPAGRMIFPLVTMQRSRLRGPRGLMIKVVRRDGTYDASMVSFVGIFPCIGAIDPAEDKLVLDALKRRDYKSIRALRRDAHEPDSTCWLHSTNFCLSTAAAQ